MPEIRITDLVDIVIVAVLIWAFLGWLRRARARIALAGVAIAAVLYFVARQFELQMTIWILQGFFAVGVLVLVVVFQEDLRRGLEQLAVWGLRRKPRAAPPDAVDVLVRTVRRLAASRTGALIVLPGREPIDRHVAGGVPLGGVLSEPLLLSLFDVHSPGHDGAIVVEGDRIARFALHLPLSTDAAQLAGTGTRHAAALGLAERTDAFCIVVSEERGTVALARDGRLLRLAGAEELAGELRRFLVRREPGAGKPATSRLRRAATRVPEAVIALGASAGLWLLLVPGSAVDRFQREVPVVVANLPEGWSLESADPPQVTVYFEGTRRSLLLEGANASPEVEVDALLAQLGRRTFEIGTDQVKDYPDGWTPLRVDPDKVKLSLVNDGGKGGTAANGGD